MTVKRISDELSAIQQRMLDRAEKVNDTEDIVYQHTVLCQTVMPYRNPGNEVRLWKRVQGRAHLEIQAGRAFDSKTEDFVDVGLPFGPKPRLALYHLNARAIRTRSRDVEVEDSLTAFVKRIGFATHGRNIRAIKDQLSRLSASDFRIGVMREGKPTTVKASIVSGFELWAPQDVNQRVLWPTYVRFSQEYFDSLVQHAVPLEERAIAALSHNAMALDTYTWMAQRLHRVPDAGALVSWKRLHEQFGQGYKRPRKFREVFTSTLKQVKTVYPNARFDVDNDGLLLRTSPPPIKRRMIYSASN